MEKVQVGFRVASRLGLFIYYLVGFLVSSYRIHWTTKDPIARKIRFSANANKTTARICRRFGIDITVVNPLTAGQHGLVVGNHMGFVDILVVNSLWPCLFVTSEEMRKTPLLGLLTEMAGCLYVDRKTGRNIKKELQEMISYLGYGFRVVIYPEATSHNGEEVLPFKRTLLTSAAHADVPILPYVFNFTNVDGQNFSLKNRDKVCWYGNISFAKSLLGLFTIKNLNCEVKFLTPIKTNIEEPRADLATRTRSEIAENFIPAR